VGTAPGRYLLKAVLVAVLLTGLCAWPAHAWGGREGLLALGLAGAITLATATLAHALGRLIERATGGPKAGVQGAQAATTVRLLLTLAVSAPVLIVEPVPAVQFGVWLAIHYLAQLALELVVSLQELSQNHGPTGTPARSPQPEATLPSGSTETGSKAEGSTPEGVIEDARRGETE
jgi:hypothetical protein